ncbi:sensor histidine kinase [Bifidobacterium samirii]|uniref:histidine kinase n=1 Tax=Bifidobacterium samirii TaxID=2306974 RepID=A0A430FGY5_9BIFI|nr:histidine kinase [Bifidobacterium samirii]RSX52087.1 two-component system sensor histidine kinase [Bifidobacterium samirii]
MTRLIRPTRIAHWLRAHTLAADALGTVCWALFFAFAYVGTGIAGSPGLLFTYDEPLPQLAWSVLLLVPTALRRWRPRTAVLLFAAIVVLHLVFGPTLILTDLFAPFMLYAAIVHGEPRDTVPTIVLSFALAALAAAVITWAADAGPLIDPDIRASDLQYYLAEDGSYVIESCALFYPAHRITGQCATYFSVGTLGTFLAIAVCLASAIVVAFWQRAQLVTIRMMQERNAAIEAGEAEERHIAALAERARIARDMHDVVAHTLSIIIVQSDGGRYAGAHDPAVARSTMETIRHESERALHDMKRLLGVFGGSAHADYADIDALVGQARDAAADGSIVRRVGGPSAPMPQRLSADAGVAAYHVVQEALTNVRKYAGRGVHVTIDETWTADSLTIAVVDDGRGASSTLDGHKPGYGLLGMRERVGAAGGTVDAGPRVGGGFAVRATLPLATTRTTPDRPEAGLAEAAATATAVPAAMPLATTAGMTAATSAAVTPAKPMPATPMGPMGAPSSVPAGDPMGGSAAGPAAEPATGQTAGTTANPMMPVAVPASSAAYGSAPADGAPAAGNTDRRPSFHRDVPRSGDGASASMPSGARPDASDRGFRVSDGIRTAAPVSIPRIPSWREAAERLHRRPLVQAAAEGGAEFNWVERLSRWTQRHYLATDVMLTTALFLFCLGTPPSIFDWGTSVSAYGRALDILIVATSTLPLMFRRRFPETTAAVTVVFALVQLVLVDEILVTNMFSLCALYSAVMYGRERAWRWTGASSLLVSLTVGFKVTVSMAGYSTIARWLLRSPDFEMSAAPTMVGRVFNLVMWSGMVFAMCLAMIAAARWSRSSGSNALVLQAREEALLAEQAKQRVLAANMERDRIGANIQTEVSETLTRVIDQAASGIRMLDEAAARGVTPSAQEIGDEFAAIGRQGRAALKRMRELLGVLRETGFSDEAHEHRQPDMRLRPAASLDEQLRNAAPVTAVGATAPR